MFGQKGGASTYLYCGAILLLPALIIGGLYGAFWVALISGGLALASHIAYLNDPHNIVERSEKGEPLTYGLLGQKEEKPDLSHLTPEQIEDRRNVELFRTLANFPPSGKGEAYDRGARSARVRNGFTDYDKLPNSDIRDRGVQYCCTLKYDVNTGTSEYRLLKVKYVQRDPNIPALGYEKTIVKEWER